MVGQASNEVLLFLPQIGIMRLLQPTPTKSSLLGEEHCIGLLNLDEKLLTSRRLCNTGGAIVVEGDDFFEDFPPVMPASPEVTARLLPPVRPASPEVRCQIATSGLGRLRRR